MISGCEVFFAQPDAMSGSLVQSLKVSSAVRTGVQVKYRLSCRK